MKNLALCSLPLLCGWILSSCGLDDDTPADLTMGGRGASEAGGNSSGGTDSDPGSGGQNLGGGPAGPETPVVMSFVPYWRSRVDDIDYSRLTHIAYFWVYPNEDGSLHDDDVKHADLITMRDRIHEVDGKALITVGKGEALSKTMPEPALRQRFVQDLVDYVKENELDGVDMDWERFDFSFPNPADLAGYSELAVELCSALHKARKLCTADVYSSSYSGDILPDEVLSETDFVNVMAYDYHGAWSATAEHHASMQDSLDGIEYYLKQRSVPANKVTFGIPAYGRAFGGATLPGQKFEGTGSQMEGVWTYAQIHSALASGELTPGSGELTYAVKEGEEPEIVFYDGPSDVVAKAKYAEENGLLGIMIWEVTMDVSGEGSLLSGLPE